MKYIYYLIALFILNISCTSIKNAYIENKNEEITFLKNKVINFNYDETGRMVIKLKINNIINSFLFDTGAPTLFFYNKDNIKNFINKKNYYSANGVKTPDKKKLNVNTFIIDSINSQIFFGKHKSSMVLNNDKINNCYNTEIIGILGSDIFLYSEFPILLDFKNKMIKTIDSSFDKKDFKEVKSNFKAIGNKVVLKLMINGVNKWVTFDTGYNGFIHLKQYNFDNKIRLKNATFFADAEPKFGNANVFPNSNIEIFNYHFKGNITSLENVKVDVLGMKFIKNFNWIIDYENEKVYIKPIVNVTKINSHLKDYTKFKYKSKIVNDKIIVVAKLLKSTEYKLGDEIISIKGVSISTENICDYQKILEKSDWKDLDIKIK